VPRLVGKKVVGAAASDCHTAVHVWAEAGELFTFGNGALGRLGHGETEHGHVPRLVEALAGQKVVGASAGANHSAVWTDMGELFTFGFARYGILGHGGEQPELVPRLAGKLAGKRMSLRRGWSRQERRWLVHGQAVFTQLHGQRQGSSSPLEMEMMGSWTMAGTRRGACAKAGCKWGPGPLDAVGARVLKPESRAEACVEVAGFTALPSAPQPVPRPHCRRAQHEKQPETMHLFPFQLCAFSLCFRSFKAA